LKQQERTTEENDEENQWELNQKYFLREKRGIFSLEDRNCGK
jgi:hypothetical protein